MKSSLKKLHLLLTRVIFFLILKYENMQKICKKKYQEIRKGTNVFHKSVGIAAVCSNRSLALSSIPTASTQKHLRKSLRTTQAKT